MEIPEVTFEEAPRIMFWEATKACDFSCKHCRAEAVPSRSPDELSTGEARELLGKLGAKEIPVLVITGGDPLKRPDMMELVEFSVSAGFRTLLAPSGTRNIEEATLAELSEAGLSGVALSLDGSTAELHDKFRGEQGIFDATVEVAKWCAEFGLPLQINTTVSKGTVRDLPKISTLVEDLGAVRWSLFFLVPTGRGQLLDPLSSSKTEETLDWLYRKSRRASFGVKTTEAHHFRRVFIQNELKRGEDINGVLDWSSSRSTPSGGLGIHDGNGVVFVSHKGDIYPSGFLPLAGGNIREDDLLKVYRQSPLFTELRDKSLRKGKCGYCEYRGICGGSRAQAFAATGDYLAADPTCIYQPRGVT